MKGNIKSINVLLLDGHTVQTISVARSLKQIGVNVYAFIEKKISYGFVSRYIDKKIICPNLKEHESNYLLYLCDFLKTHTIFAIIPMYDDSAFFLSKNKDYIQDSFSVKCIIPDYNIIKEIGNKSSLMKICYKNGIPCPNTIDLSDYNLNDAANLVGFPSIIKPNFSSGAKGIVLVHNKFELNNIYPKIKTEFGQCSLQEYIKNSGIYYNVMMYRDSHDICHEPTIIKIMRYFPLKGGTSCYCETINNQPLNKLCSHLLDVIGWNGFADIDVIEDITTGEFKIIELNVRIPSSIYAASISGINFPEMMLCDCMNQNISQCNPSYGKTMRFMGLDVMWFIFSPDRFSFRPSWFRFISKNLYYQDGSLYDPLPMITGCISGVIKYANSSFRKSKL
jgi:D-aspartate ligase